MACLLCRRQFPNKEALVRHQQLSDLHKVMHHCVVRPEDLTVLINTQMVNQMYFLEKPGGSQTIQNE